jgi:hypothetical protein
LNDRYGCRTREPASHSDFYLKRRSGHQFLSGIAKSYYHAMGRSDGVRSISDKVNNSSRQHNIRREVRNSYFAIHPKQIEHEHYFESYS